MSLAVGSMCNVASRRQSAHVDTLLSVDRRRRGYEYYLSCQVGDAHQGSSSLLSYHDKMLTHSLQSE